MRECWEEFRDAKGQAHPQLMAVDGLLEAGEEWQSGRELPAASSLREARQLLGNAVAPPRMSGGSREVKRAAWRVVVEGLELQALVDETAKGFTAGVRRRVQRRRSAATHLREWRLVVVRGGPARAAALARVGVAREAVSEATRLTVMPGVGSVRPMVQWAVEQWAPLALQGTLSDAPFTAWWLRAWFLRWAGQAREELQLLNFIWHAWQVPRLRALLRSWRQLGPVNAQFGARATLDMDRIGRAAIGVGIAVPWEPGGTEGRRWRDEDGAWRAVSFSKGMAHAWRAWKAAGGHKAMDRERGFRRDVEETRRAARLSDWLERCGRRISPALAALANARRLLRQRPVARRRMLLNEEVGSGLAADGRGRWAVESILAWRGGAGDRAALVRWSGFDPASGEPWTDSWEPRAALTSDLRGGGLIRRRRTAAEIREEERRAR